MGLWGEHAHARCPRRKAGGHDRVTLHFRNGDVALAYGAQMLKGYHDQPPCLYYHRVIETGLGGRPFREVQLVFSKEEPQNPCIADIRSRHQDKLVLSPTNTVVGDTCLLLKVGLRWGSGRDFFTQCVLPRTR